MGYYDYSSYFTQLINRSDILHQDMQSLLLNVQLFIFIFVCFFVWFLISRMTRRKGD